MKEKYEKNLSRLENILLEVGWLKTCMVRGHKMTDLSASIIQIYAKRFEGA